MRLMYITRKFPPMVGGMEKLSFALAQEFFTLVDTTLITWGGSQKYLPIIIPFFFFKALYLITTKKIDHLHIGDALLSPLGLLLKTIFQIKTTVTVMGLDVTFDFPGYQFIIPRCLKRYDKIICISNATREECIKRGIPAEKCVVIPCGVYPEEWKIQASESDLEKIIGRSVIDTKVIITVGRLVKRKGVYWFIENVLPKLARNILYVVVGNGPEKERIEDLIKRLDLKDKVILMGKISDHDLKIIYNTASLFVMPNIKVDNNIEGFGIVAIEASSTGLPVIASDIEGISSAVINNKTGNLIENKNVQQFMESTNKIDSFNRKEVAEITRKNYSWKTIGKEYINAIS